LEPVGRYVERSAGRTGTYGYESGVPDIGHKAGGTASPQARPSMSDMEIFNESTTRRL
jgi:hypothetical protein